MQPIGKIIRTKRESKNLTQDELAKIASVSRHTIINIEANKLDGIRMGTVEKVLHVFGYELATNPIIEESYPEQTGSIDIAAFLAQFEH